VASMDITMAHKLTRKIVILASIVSLALHLSYRESAADGQRIDEFLRQWIRNDLYSFSDAKGKSRLFVRRDPVRAFIYSDVPLAKDILSENISVFSEYSNLAVDFTNVNPNLIAVVTSPINDGDKPNWQIFRRLGMPDTALTVVGASASWASGCGMYTFAGEQGQPALSLIFAEKSLPESSLRDCLVEGTIHAFGMRVAATTSVRSSDGYLYYLQLARALQVCDARLDSTRAELDRAMLENKYLDCAVEQLKR
jgi:hypothetical protein